MEEKELMKNLFDLKAWIEYDRKTGLLIWKCTRRLMKKGKECGYKNRRGYRIISFRGAQYKAHRVAWFLHFGYLPKGDIVMKNGIRDDLRIKNLRERVDGKLKKGKFKGFRRHKNG